MPSGVSTVGCPKRGWCADPTVCHNASLLVEFVGMELYVEIAQYALLVVGWTVAFLLGRELQRGFAQWRERKGLSETFKD